ncbi:predicted protein [Brucella sp. 83/13]|nr:predicted protein [Brucella sp. 83/13]
MVFSRAFRRYCRLRICLLACGKAAGFAQFSLGTVRFLLKRHMRPNISGTEIFVLPFRPVFIPTVPKVILRR